MAHEGQVKCSGCGKWYNWMIVTIHLGKYYCRECFKSLVINTMD